MALEQQVGADAGVDLGRDFRLDGLLRFTVGNSVVLALAAMQDSHQDVRAVGGHGGYGSDAGEEQDAVRTRIGDAVKAFEDFANLGHRPDQRRAQVAAEFVLDLRGKLLEPHGPELGDHAAGFQGLRQSLGRSPEYLLRLNADLVIQRPPTFGAGRVAGRVPAVPPNKEKVGIGRPRGFLLAVVRLELVKDIANRCGGFGHSVRRGYYTGKPLPLMTLITRIALI